MELKTPLYDVHVEEGGKIVPFAGYLLPVQYGTGVIKEHMAVRQQCGLFDVSHMGEILFTGPTALATLNPLLTNDYSNPYHKVIDDITENFAEYRPQLELLGLDGQPLSLFTHEVYKQVKARE